VQTLPEGILATSICERAIVSDDSTPTPADNNVGEPTLSRTDRYVILSAAFLGWMCAGLEMSMFLAVRPAARHFLADITTGNLEEQVGKWFSWYLCAFLMGAAAGGLFFGWMGDRVGRAKAMGVSILCFSAVTGLSYFVTSLEQLVFLRFIACMGIGGMWPNGVALASEAWPEGSRPLLAGLIGTAANFGLAAMGMIARQFPITPDSWRWVMLLGASPFVLGLLVLALVPESPSWLKSRGTAKQHAAPASLPMSTVFKPPYIHLTIIGICLWLMPWADKAGQEAGVPGLQGQTQLMRSSGAILGSLLGGFLANMFGRRSTYFAVSLGSLLVGQYIFRYLDPLAESFAMWVFIMGFIGTIFFGWLPLYLPELFPTEVRATGTGVTFNFGRILAALGVLGAGGLMLLFEGDYARVGRITSLIYALGMVVILFAPDTSGKRLDE
jgi:hypothetical protein